MLKEIIKSPALKKGMGVASVIFTGVVAIAGAIADQQREREFEDLKKDIAELKSERGEA